MLPLLPRRRGNPSREWPAGPWPGSRRAFRSRGRRRRGGGRPVIEEEEEGGTGGRARGVSSEAEKVERERGRAFFFPSPCWPPPSAPPPKSMLSLFLQLLPLSFTLSTPLSHPQAHLLERLDRDDTGGGLKGQALVGVAVLFEARRSHPRSIALMLPPAIVAVIAAAPFSSSSSSSSAAVAVVVPALSMARPLATSVVVVAVAVVAAVATALGRHSSFVARERNSER